MLWRPLAQSFAAVLASHLIGAIGARIIQNARFLKTSPTALAHVRGTCADIRLTVYAEMLECAYKAQILAQFPALYPSFALHTFQDLVRVLRPIGLLERVKNSLNIFFVSCIFSDHAPEIVNEQAVFQEPHHASSVSRS